MTQDESIEAKLGSYAPDFRLPATNATEIGLSDFRDKNNVVLFFVREYN